MRDSSWMFWSCRLAWRDASRCLQLAGERPLRFRIANTSATPDSMRAIELGSGVETAGDMVAAVMVLVLPPVIAPLLKVPPVSPTSEPGIGSVKKAKLNLPRATVAAWKNQVPSPFGKEGGAR